MNINAGRFRLEPVRSPRRWTFHPPILVSLFVPESGVRSFLSEKTLRLFPFLLDHGFFPHFLANRGVQTITFGYDQAWHCWVDASGGLVQFSPFFLRVNCLLPWLFVLTWLDASAIFTLGEGPGWFAGLASCPSLMFFFF